ncbi:MULTISPECIES: glycine cleavage system protein GcvH [Salinivibrio]|jgi:glycine cleavage system H protein|uniref:Glycine cleavage system H protein n=1 Tax=Salinivibrio proteolyticus TaxID=334715 RepID=A0ABY7LFY9_9GAMM|nr:MULTISPECIES: glycine cleavage system protein GcvH [Salinivibrio]ODP98754.1 glycine cleavage system protein H [Salinivibrio sp. DV]OOF11491.1 glycine cleavage system protein H [Salinivibrio sp. PR5]OOF13902.1 glycine cleavage system protein H [Salinivibrio sp. PR919]OOF19192.1 glycine cleavage system protein H [Salinivibrio sp. PR932]OOF28789.1 glycine cleavage system protein H [Salinivibrio sp. IB872]
MSDIPSELKFTSTHEWVRPEGDGLFTIGISDHAQALLGDMVFIDLPDEGDSFDAGDDCAVAESVKAASDIYAPISGEVVAVNEELDGSPELVNSDPYGDGWLFQIRATDESEIDDLLDAQSYEETLGEEDDDE